MFALCGEVRNIVVCGAVGGYVGKESAHHLKTKGVVFRDLFCIRLRQEVQKSDVVL